MVPAGLVAVAVAVVTAGSARSVPVNSWCGEFDYKGGFANRSALNISVAGDTANITMVWARKAHSCSHCCPDSEYGLNVTRSGARITFLGAGNALDYYTFEASLNAAGDGMVGNITNGGRTYGSFTAQTDGCPAIASCTPKPNPPSPRPGPPGPLPPPPPHPPVRVWPLPLKLECTKADPAATTATAALLSASVTVTLTGPGAAAPVAAQAAARYQLLLRAAGSAAGPVKVVAIEVEAASDVLGQATNYSYSLEYSLEQAATATATVAVANMVRTNGADTGMASVTASAASPFAVGLVRC